MFTGILGDAAVVIPFPPDRSMPFQATCLSRGRLKMDRDAGYAQMITLATKWQGTAGYLLVSHRQRQWLIF